jgi:hypothetical protein
MPCVLLVLVVLFPRIAILLLYFFTTFFTGVYDTIIVPLLGFIFLPLTLLAYTYLTKTHQAVDSFFLIVMLVAIILDLGLVGGGEWRRRRG